MPRPLGASRSGSGEYRLHGRDDHSGSVFDLHPVGADLLRCSVQDVVHDADQPGDRQVGAEHTLGLAAAQQFFYPLRRACGVPEVGLSS